MARQLSSEVVAKTTVYDPQWSAKSQKDIRVSFSEPQLQRYLGLGKQAGELKIYPAPRPVEQKLDLTAAKKVDGNSWQFDPATVKMR